jgi:hypothetical protein
VSQRECPGDDQRKQEDYMSARRHDKREMTCSLEHVIASVKAATNIH